MITHVAVIASLAFVVGGPSGGQELTREQRLFMGLPAAGPVKRHLVPNGEPDEPLPMHPGLAPGKMIETQRNAGMPAGPPMTFKLLGTGGASCCEWIAADGVITLTTPQAFREFLGGLGKDASILQDSITFNSPGGDFFAALALGREIRRSTRMWTAVGRTEAVEGTAGGPKTYRIGNGVCLSACLLAFMGGKTRVYDMGDGAPPQGLALVDYALDQPVSVVGRPSADALADAGLPTAGLLRLAMEGYAAEMGVDPQIAALLETSGQPGGVHLVSQDEADRFGLNTPAKPRTTWSLAASGDGLVLYGSGEDQWTHYAVGLQCLRDDRRALFYALAVPVAPGDGSPAMESAYRAGIGGVEVMVGPEPEPARIAAVQLVPGEPHAAAATLRVTVRLEASQIDLVREGRATVRFETADSLRHALPTISLTSPKVAGSIDLLLRNCPSK